MLRRLFRYVTSFNLGPKLFFSHFVVALVAMFTFVAVSLAMPPLSGNLAAGLAATVAAVLASLFVTERILAPVRSLRRATRRITAGGYSERVPVAEDDELGSLSESFNSMAVALEEEERRREEFISDVSHELKTPLSTLRGYAEGVMDGIFEPDEETWGLMYAETERMRRLVEDLQQLSRIESGQLSINAGPVSTEDSIRQAAESMLPLFTEKGVELENEAVGDLPPVRADSDRLAQVLGNLLSNALRHTPAGGRVTVDAKTRNNEVLFTVSDTGTGVAPEHLPYLFERFYRVEKSRSRDSGGSGVGLAISRALVEAMNGRIRAESGGPKTGATFILELPVAER